MIRLLHVDDDPDILELTEMSLDMNGEFEVVACLSGDEALLKIHGFMPDVFLLDVMMPGLTGPETLDKLRTIPGLKSVPAIFMTARLGAASQEELFALGAKDVIAKPFDPMTLGKRIKDAMSR